MNDLTLAEMLAQRVTLLTEEQGERHGWTSTLKRLVKRKLVSRQTITYSPNKPCRLPFWIHRPRAEFTVEIARDILSAAKRRQERTPSRNIETYQATELAYSIFGDAARLHGNIFTLGHAHIVTEIYLALDAGERAHFRPEFTPNVPEKFEKVPDSAVLNDRGEIVRYHEAVSASYPISRLMLLAEHCDRFLAGRSASKNSGIYFW